MRAKLESTPQNLKRNPGCGSGSRGRGRWRRNSTRGGRKLFLGSVSTNIPMLEKKKPGRKATRTRRIPIIDEENKRITRNRNNQQRNIDLNNTRVLDDGLLHQKIIEKHLKKQVYAYDEFNPTSNDDSNDDALVIDLSDQEKAEESPKEKLDEEVVISIPETTQCKPETLDLLKTLETYDDVSSYDDTPLLERLIHRKTPRKRKKKVGKNSGRKIKRNDLDVKLTTALHELSGNKDEGTIKQKVERSKEDKVPQTRSNKKKDEVAATEKLNLSQNVEEETKLKPKSMEKPVKTKAARKVYVEQLDELIDFGELNL